MTSELEKIKTPILDTDWWDMYENSSFRNIKKMSSEQKSFMTLLDKTEVYEPKRGIIVEGVYKGKTKKDHLFYYNGFKDVIHVEQRPSENKYLKNTEIGDVVNVMITLINNKEYEIVGSVANIYETIAHNELLNLDEDVVVMAHVRTLNPAGYDLDIIHGKVTLPGFMPNTLAGINKLYDPESIVGQKFEVMIESYSESEGTYIVSRKRYLQTLISADIEKLKTNTLYIGRVTGTTPFGVFVEFNSDSDKDTPACLTGMIHKDNIVDDWKEKIRDIKSGSLIEFYVKEIIKNNKIILTQVIRETLWDTIEPGDVFKSADIKDIKPFGVLVVLDSGTIGLIHTSEVEKLEKKFNINEKIDVRVLAVDRSSRKIFLTLNKK